jgi:hypothetical protein
MTTKDQIATMVTEYVDSGGKRWTIDELRAEGFDVAYFYTDRKGKVWMRLNSHAHIPPPNKRFDS